MTGSASDGATAAALTAPRHATTPACTGGCRVTPARTSSPVRPSLTVGYVTPYGFTLRRWTLGGHHHHYLLSGRSRRKQREPAGVAERRNSGLGGEVVVAAAEGYYHQIWRTRGRRRRRRSERYYAVMHHRPAPVCLPAA
uniref:Protein E20B n=1 Tax=Elephant endotheliotropic herpesvirus 4 TaxID=548914 RepID=A0A0S2CBK7_9BETA|nr:protein E20B [Elephant endotheliotropic herpesvirus 4]